MILLPMTLDIRYADIVYEEHTVSNFNVASM
jgi:hypothetical protein